MRLTYFLVFFFLVFRNFTICDTPNTRKHTNLFCHFQENPVFLYVSMFFSVFFFVFFLIFSFIFLKLLFFFCVEFYQSGKAFWEHLENLIFLSNFIVFIDLIIFQRKLSQFILLAFPPPPSYPVKTPRRRYRPEQPNDAPYSPTFSPPHMNYMLYSPLFLFAIFVVFRRIEGYR